MADSDSGGTGGGDEGSIHWDLGSGMSYGGYLGLDQLLSCQKPMSGEHDEMLFIVIHQATELWLKLSLYELSATRDCIKTDRLGAAFKMLARLAAIQRQLTQSWDVLSTLTPFDYTRFRDTLGHSSGFQSFQYRMLEFILGQKNRTMTRVHQGNAAAYDPLIAELEAPSLYDEALQLLHRRGFDVPAECLDRDWAQPYSANPAVEAAWKAVYQDVETHWDLYELAEKLVDLEDRFQQWRFRHMTTVERIIGFKTGTGGSSGVPYLAKALQRRFFPELWTVRTLL
ncbi:MAG: tryptophan 2,3-dioxygenase [Inquilinaceae bacterium]